MKEKKSGGQQQVKATISFYFPLSNLERHKCLLQEPIGVMLITYEINMLKHSSVRRRGREKTRIG